MNELIEKAIEHITDQMMEDQNNPAIVAIEEHLTNICTTETVASKLLTEGKTLKAALNEIREVAKKRQVGGCGCLSDEEGFFIVEKYYGITEEDKQLVRQPRKDNVIDVMDFLV